MLQKVAVCGGLIAIGGAIFFTEKIQGNFRQQEYFRKSMKLLRQYGPAVESLGEPIRTKHLDLGDTQKNRVDGFKARITIPVKGPNGLGTLHSWASRETVHDSWEVDRLDIELTKTGQKWTFFKSSRNENSS
ncbi:hypothetical protein ScPMuIL_016737 [Solemya velum]